MNAIVKQESGFSLAPRNLDEAFRLADMLADSELVPKDFKGKPGNCMIAIQWGAEIGLKPLQALQNLAVINGRPCLWGDALIALVRNSPLCEYIIESVDAQGTAVCQVKRRGEPEQVRTFSQLDAKTAGLLGKQGPWQTNPQRMKQMRARAFALRDVFPDVLKGISVAEEVLDHNDLSAPASKPNALAHTPAAEAPPELVEAATAAASKGIAAYTEFWTGAGKDGRRLLADKHNGFKAQADAADKARTVDADAGFGEVEGEAQ